MIRLTGHVARIEEVRNSKNFGRNAEGQRPLKRSTRTRDGTVHRPRIIPTGQ